MIVYQRSFDVRTDGRRTYEVTDRAAAIAAASKVTTGLCNIFSAHTSCSIFINENADPSVQYDLMGYLDRLVPERDPRYTHTDEGDDDMPAHIKTALLPVSLTVPVGGGHLLLGTWQGIFLWEHRSFPHRRRLTVTVTGE